jgi:hypothetical protein
VGFLINPGEKKEREKRKKEARKIKKTQWRG